LPTSPDEAELDYVANPRVGQLYLVRFAAPEFTSLCPVTGQPDFAVLHLAYVPAAQCVELKSLKLYVWGFRDRGAYHEAVTNAIVADLVTAVEPRFLRLRAEFNVRGGLYTDVVVEHTAPGWTPPPVVALP
jgi:7-cyano-7-deazaguanine reductase